MLRVTYKGLSYHDLENVILKAIVERTGTHFDEKLLPFVDEISKCGGSISVDIPEDLINLSIQYKNVPEDLKLKISKVLGESI